MQDCIGVAYTATQSTPKTIQARSWIFIIFVSANLQDCIGVTYTATQSTLELFKLEVNYSSTLFQQDHKIA